MEDEMYDKDDNVGQAFEDEACGGEWRDELLPDGTPLRSYWLPDADDPFLVRYGNRDPEAS